MLWLPGLSCNGDKDPTAGFRITMVFAAGKIVKLCLLPVSAALQGTLLGKRGEAAPTCDQVLHAGAEAPVLPAQGPCVSTLILTLASTTLPACNSCTLLPAGEPGAFPRTKREPILHLGGVNRWSQNELNRVQKCLCSSPDAAAVTVRLSATDYSCAAALCSRRPFLSGGASPAGQLPHQPAVPAVCGMCNQ